jgi:hypothetical protein
MPIFRTALICLCVFLNATFLRGDKSAKWLDSILIQSPLRLHDLSGDRIVEIARTRTSHPLLFPKPVSIFERLDGSLNQLYTLEELASNPGLAPQNKFHSTKAPTRQNSITPISRPVNFAEREKKLFDTSLLLVPKTSNPLPSDDQLKAFLEEGRLRYTPPVNPKEIIDNLLKDEYADHPVVSLLNESPEVKKVLKSESFQLGKNGLFSSAKVALQSSSPSSNQVAFTGSLPEPPSINDFDVVTPGQANAGLTSLKLQARKPSRDGTLKPAQASEIYLTTQDLKELLKDMTKNPAIAGEVRSVAELWAKAEKNVSRNPEIALGVKSILLSAKVGRARTDPYGQASLENLSPDDKYYVIGIDKDIETDVVTIWSKEVEVAPGENLVELSSTDIIYQE